MAAQRTAASAIQKGCPDIGQHDWSFRAILTFRHRSRNHCSHRHQTWCSREHNSPRLSPVLNSRARRRALAIGCSSVPFFVITHLMLIIFTPSPFPWIPWWWRCSHNLDADHDDSVEHTMKAPTHSDHTCCSDTVVSVHAGFSFKRRKQFFPYTYAASLFVFFFEPTRQPRIKKLSVLSPLQEKQLTISAF